MSTSDPIRVLVCGAAGRMGREVIRAAAAAEDMAVVGAVDRTHSGVDAGQLAGGPPLGVTVVCDLEATLQAARPDVVVDFTAPGEAQRNAHTALAAGAALVIGTTGLSPADLTELDHAARHAGLGALVAPNFAIGAVLLMDFAARAARYFPDVEIIEMHHERKLDSPSGTALLTAQRIAAARAAAAASPSPQPTGAVTKVTGARGARYPSEDGVPIHSVRLPGYIAHEEVLFGGPGQLLSIRHDSMDRASFMPGVLLAVRRVRELTGLIVGLENVLDAW